MTAAQYLDYLALERQVSPATQKQALNAMVLLARKVHGMDDFQIEFGRATSGARRPPTVLTREEVWRLFAQLEDPCKLLCELMYGSGLRQSEVLKLRVKDLDFGQGTIQIHDAKGGKHRVVTLPRALEGRLRDHLERIRDRHHQDLAAGEGDVHLPESLQKNIRTHAANGLGSGPFPPPTFPHTPERGGSGDFIFTKNPSPARSPKRFGGSDWRSGPPATRSDIPSPRTSWKPVSTSAPSRTSSDMRMFPPP